MDEGEMSALLVVGVFGLGAEGAGRRGAAAAAAALFGVVATSSAPCCDLRATEPSRSRRRVRSRVADRAQSPRTGARHRGRARRSGQSHRASPRLADRRARASGPRLGAPARTPPYLSVSSFLPRTRRAGRSFRRSDLASSGRQIREPRSLAAQHLSGLRRRAQTSGGHPAAHAGLLSRPSLIRSRSLCATRKSPLRGRRRIDNSVSCTARLRGVVQR